MKFIVTAQDNDRAKYTRRITRMHFAIKILTRVYCACKKYRRQTTRHPVTWHFFFFFLIICTGTVGRTKDDAPSYNRGRPSRGYRNNYYLSLSESLLQCVHLQTLRGKINRNIIIIFRRNTFPPGCRRSASKKILFSEIQSRYDESYYKYITDSVHHPRQTY